MKLKPIKTIYDYNQAKKYLESIFHAELTEEESNNVAILEILMEEFERKGKVSKEDLVVEPLIDYVFDLVSNASKYEEGGILERGLKLGEEYGELSAEILKLKGYKRTTEDEGRIHYNILLESTDCLIMIFDIMTQMGFTKEQICDMSEKQVNKWLKNIEIK
jgi:hypothetical protein